MTTSWLSPQGVLASQMGMEVTEMQRYSQLSAAERAQTPLPGFHPPVKGFYLIKPSPSIGSTKSVARSPSLLTRLRHPRQLSSTHSLQPSLSMSDFASASSSQAPDVLDDASLHARPDPVQKDAADVMIHVDDDTDEQYIH